MVTTVISILHPGGITLKLQQGTTQEEQSGAPCPERAVDGRREARWSLELIGGSS